MTRCASPRHTAPPAMGTLQASLSPKQPQQPRFSSAASSLTSLPWSHPGPRAEAAVHQHPLGNSFLPFGSDSESISRLLFLYCYLFTGEKEADLGTSISTNMFIGTHIPQANTELPGNLACCVLFKMWTEHSVPACVLCPSHLMISCLCPAPACGIDGLLVLSFWLWFWSQKSSRGQLENVTDMNILLLPSHPRGRWWWSHSVPQFRFRFTYPLLLSAYMEGFQLQS